MRTSRITSDWFTISLRWLILLGLTVALALSDQLVVQSNLLLLGLAAWNIFLTCLAGTNRRLVRHGGISLTIDLLVAGSYFWLQGGFSSPAYWICLLPLFSAALYFGIRGGVTSAVLIALLQVGVTYLGTFSIQSLRLSLPIALLTLLLGAFLGYLGKKTIGSNPPPPDKLPESVSQAKRMDDERLRAIYNITSTLAATLNYQRVLDIVLDLSQNALNPGAAVDERLVGAVMLFREDRLEVRSARRFTQPDLRMTPPGKEGILGKAIEGGDPILAVDIRSDPELGQTIALQGCSQVYCFPLRSGFDVYGVLLFGHPELGYFTPDRTEILEIIGRQAVAAIQNAGLYQDLLEERDRMVEAQEEARKKLARDLHDGPTQSVAAMAMRINLARRMLEKDPKSASDELVKIEELAQRTTKEIRHMLFTLRPLVLESQGLVAALQAMADKVKETFSQNVFIQVDEKLIEQLEMGKQGVIFYIVDEAVNNARKHARAEHIWVRLGFIAKEMALLEIQDDGAGFDVEAVTRAYDERGSLGMVNLRERAELVNGLLNIESAPGAGTKVQVAIPLSEEAADRLHHARGSG